MFYSPSWIILLLISADWRNWALIKMTFLTPKTDSAIVQCVCRLSRGYLRWMAAKGTKGQKKRPTLWKEGNLICFPCFIRPWFIPSFLLVILMLWGSNEDTNDLENKADVSFYWFCDKKQPGHVNHCHSKSIRSKSILTVSTLINAYGTRGEEERWWMMNRWRDGWRTMAGCMEVGAWWMDGMIDGKWWMMMEG